MRAPKRTVRGGTAKPCGGTPLVGQKAKKNNKKAALKANLFLISEGADDGVEVGSGEVGIEEFAEAGGEESLELGNAVGVELVVNGLLGVLTGNGSVKGVTIGDAYESFDIATQREKRRGTDPATRNLAQHGIVMGKKSIILTC